MNLFVRAATGRLTNLTPTNTVLADTEVKLCVPVKQATAQDIITDMFSALMLTYDDDKERTDTAGKFFNVL